MNGDERHPAFRGPRDSLPYGLPDVEHLGVEKNAVLCSKRHHKAV
jgi:hypothetical protein